MHKSAFFLAACMILDPLAVYGGDLVFQCDGRTMEGWRVFGVHSGQCVGVEEDSIKLRDESSFKECGIMQNVGSVPPEYTFQIELKLNQLIGLVIDPSKWGCEVVWCHQIIYVGNEAGNSFSVNFSRDGIWIFYNPTQQPAGPGGTLVKIPDTARFVDQQWHTWTFHVNATGSVDDDYCDIYRDGTPVAMRIRVHNRECPDGTISICNRGIEPNPAEMLIKSIRLWKGAHVEAVSE